MSILNCSIDTFFEQKNNNSFKQVLDKNIRFINEFDLKNPVIWKRFVNQFLIHSDNDGTWRGEYWGKMMRGACFVYTYTKDRELYNILNETVKDMINSADKLGRISTYNVEYEFDAWDIWCRKYVLLGLEYFYEICEDDSLRKDIISSLCQQTDYILSKIGEKSDGKLPITSATRHWRGLNSSSLLEPIVKLFNLTKNEKYFEFAKYIVECGGTDVANIFDLAYKKELRIYQYPATKAYEMTSCFIGLLDFYRVTKKEYYKTAILNFADLILEDEFTVIGSAGCTHELFDHSKVRQANTTNGDVAQETCVTVTLMQFFHQLNLLTGDSKYIDAFEISLYNAYLGAVNTEKCINNNSQITDNLITEPLPFDSYSPLVSSVRGKLIGGFKPMNDNHYYGCCACIGSAGIGLAMKTAILSTDNGIVINLYEKGEISQQTKSGNNIKLIIDTEYPVNQEVKITVKTNGFYEIKLRNPNWSVNTKVSVNNEEMFAQKGYISIQREWNVNDIINISFDMKINVIHPIPYGSQLIMNKVIWGKNYMVLSLDKEDPIAKNHIALQRGPLMLAQDERIGYSTTEPITLKIQDNTVLGNYNIPSPYSSIFSCELETKQGSFLKFTDYASAGKDWKSKIAVWILTK